MIDAQLPDVPSLSVRSSLRVALAAAVSEVEVAASRPGGAAGATVKADELQALVAAAAAALAPFDSVP